MRGTVQSVIHSPGSGIATLVVVDQFGDICHVHADAGPLFQAMVESELHEGDEIEFTTTVIGTMAEFAIVGDGE